MGTPDPTHVEPSQKAVEAGLDALEDEPPCTSDTDALSIRAAVAKADVRCVTAFSNRHNPPYVAARQAIVRGEIGTVRIFNGRLNDAVLVPTEMLTWAAKSTPGWFLISHVTDVAQWLFGSAAGGGLR